MKTIEQLWRGNIDPIANFGCGDNNVNLLEAELCKRFDELEEKYKDEMIKLRKTINDYINVLQKQSFCEGFSLGTKIIAESFITAETLVNK